ncbi:uncharacterized protein LOC110248323 isoform X1 [Exaiptasia diaphana]|uniref:Uncharacterized protein n=2 Tax=Exaiptasia diaphana TaxID=2652724 RepID=A0A913YRF4_EXADI|nr:uncharacterized protein LOC110248323 isoform X1 [Exaiptasia diaphana]
MYETKFRMSILRGVDEAGVQRKSKNRLSMKRGKTELPTMEVMMEEIIRLKERQEEDKQASDKRVQALEDDKQVSDKKIQDLQNELSYFVKKSQETDDDLKKRQEEDKQASDKRAQALEDELSYFVKKYQETDDDLRKSMAKIDELEKTTDLLYIGQLCANLTEEIYRDFAPNYFFNEKGEEKTDYKQPHLKELDRNIERFHPKATKRRITQKRWAMKEEEIGKDVICYMENTMAMRNLEAHPSPVKKQKLEEIADRLDGHSKSYLKRVIALAHEYPNAFRESCQPFVTSSDRNNAIQSY